MPPRWPRKPDRNDPAYRRLDDRMNFAFHVAVFSAINSGMWFVHIFQKTDWLWITGFTEIWAGLLILHLLYITVIADYSVKNDG